MFTDMIRVLKTIFSLIIFVCIFLPISQCSMKTKPEVDLNTGEVLKLSETVKEDIVILNFVFNEDEEISIHSLIFLSIFIIPLFLALMPNFSYWKRILKLIFQSLFSFWLVYNSYQMVFGFSNPLIAGWFLIFASVSFLVLSLFEWLPMQHNKFKNEYASKLARTPH